MNSTPSPPTPAPTASPTAPLPLSPAPAGTLGFQAGYSYQQVRYWLPPLVAGAAAWVAFLLLGSTPLLRATGLAFVIVGFALALRPMGAILSVAGSLALAFCPSFWIQTGGSESLNPAAVLAAGAGALLFGGIVALVLVRFRRGRALPFRAFWSTPEGRNRLWLALGVALVLFAGVFLLVVGQPRSLRVTTFISAWMLYLLIDGLFRANPRPDSPPIGNLGVQHTYGLLLLFGIGVANDPLIVLFAPAILLQLFLSRQTLPLLYWLVLALLIALGVWGGVRAYVSDFWFAYDPYLANVYGIHTPFLIGGAWREPARWLGLIQIITYQFTPFGLALGLLGLARLARWYPPIGVVTMVAYGSFGWFGLLYYGRDSSVLLLPMLMLQVVWMTYALYTLWQWVQKAAKRSLPSSPSSPRHLQTAVSTSATASIGAQH